MQKFFETDYVTVGYDKANHLIILKWKVPPTSAEFRDGLNAIVIAMEYFKTGKLIADTTYLGTIHPDDQEWSATTWLLNTAKAGYACIAIILTADLFTQMSVEDTMSKVSNPIPTAYFNTLEAAIKWMNSPESFENKSHFIN